MNHSSASILNKFNLSEDKIKYFSEQTSSQKSHILCKTRDRFKKLILENLTEDEILEIFRFLDPDEITDIVQLLEKKKKKRILGKLNSNIKEKIDFLLKFAPQSAAGIMSLNYIIVQIKTPRKEILKKIEEHMSKGKKEPTILVVDDEDHLIGEIRWSSLVFYEKEKDIFSHIKILPSVIYNEDQEECINIFRKNEHEKVVVLDEENLILGIIHAKDIFKVIEDENTEDFYGLAGLHKEEDITDNAFQKVHYRLSWLLVNLVTAFLAAFVVSFFDETISKYVLLAAFMPVIAGMGGNAGTQTTAILIRSLALKKIDNKLRKKILGNEILAALINGTIIGFIVGIIAFLFNQNPLFGFVVAISLFLNLFIAAFFGTLFPLILKSFGFDPASSSNVFVTTTTDVCGFFIFLGLANLILI